MGQGAVTTSASFTSSKPYPPVHSFSEETSIPLFPRTTDWVHNGKWMMTLGG